MRNQITFREEFKGDRKNEEYVRRIMAQMPVDIFDIDGNLPEIVINCNEHIGIYASIPSVPCDGWSATIYNSREVKVSPEWPNISYFARKNNVGIGYRVNFESFGFSPDAPKCFAALNRRESDFL